MNNKNLMITLNQLIKHNKEGSFSTHTHRSKRLNQTLKTLRELGYKPQSVKNLRTTHVDALVKNWQAQELSPGTIKNRMSDLRWLAGKIGKPNIVKRTNDEYKIERRQYVDNSKNIAKSLNREDLTKITDPYVRYSLKLQEAFGLRREESIKFNPFQADKGTKISLKDTWTKGGRAREVPIVKTSQKALLEELKGFLKEQGAKALIPPDKNYYQQLKSYEYQTDQAQINKNHGLRHAYAQSRYLELAGWPSPKEGGPTSKDLNQVEKKLDYQVRLQISQELGHNREEITAVYLGR